MKRACIAGVLGCALFTAPQAFAAETDVGIFLEELGLPAFVVNAGEAIHATCIELGAQASLTPTQAELHQRCRDMRDTVIGGDNTFGFSSFGDTLNAIRQFSGEEASSQGRMVTDGTNRQFASLGARMDAIRRGARGFSSGLAVNGAGAGQTGLALQEAPAHRSSRGSGASADRDIDGGLAWFATANIGFGDRDLTTNESGYDYDGWGLTVGTDYAFGSGLVAGGALGLSRYNVDLDDAGSGFVLPVSGGGIDSEGVSLSAFFVLPLDDRFYANGIASVAWNSFDMTRLARFAPGPNATGRPAADGFTIDRTFESSTDSMAVAGQLSGGTVIDTGALSVDLYAAVDLLRINIERFTESETDNANITDSPGLALQFRSQRITSVQSALGVMLRRSINTGFGVVVPYAGVEWRHEFDNDSRTVNYRYAAAVSDISFETPTDNPERDFFELTAGLSAQFANNFFGFAQYGTTLGKSNTTAHLFTFGLRGDF